MVQQIAPRRFHAGRPILQLRQHPHHGVARQFRHPRRPILRLAAGLRGAGPVGRGGLPQPPQLAQGIRPPQAPQGGEPMVGKRRFQALQPAGGGVQVAGRQVQARQFVMDRRPQRVIGRHRLQRGLQLRFSRGQVPQQRRGQSRAVPVQARFRRCRLRLRRQFAEQGARRLPVAGAKQRQRLPASRRRGRADILLRRRRRRLRVRPAGAGVGRGGQAEVLRGLPRPSQAIERRRLRQSPGRQPPPSGAGRDLLQHLQRGSVGSGVEVGHGQRVSGPLAQLAAAGRGQRLAEEGRGAGILAAPRVHRADAVLALGAGRRWEIGRAPRQVPERGNVVTQPQQRDAAPQLLGRGQPAPGGNPIQRFEQSLMVARAFLHLQQQTLRGRPAFAVRIALQELLQRRRGRGQPARAGQQPQPLVERDFADGGVRAGGGLFEVDDRLPRYAVLDQGQRQVERQHLPPAGRDRDRQAGLVGGNRRPPVAGGRMHVAAQQRHRGRVAARLRRAAGRPARDRPARRAGLRFQLRFQLRRQAARAGHVTGVQQQTGQPIAGGTPVGGVGEQLQVAPVGGSRGGGLGGEVLRLGNEEQRFLRLRRLRVIGEDAPEALRRGRVAALRQQQRAGALQPAGGGRGLRGRAGRGKQLLVAVKRLRRAPESLQGLRFRFARQQRVGRRFGLRLTQVALQRGKRAARISRGQARRANPVPDLIAVGRVGELPLVGREPLRSAAGSRRVGHLRGKGAVEQAQRLQKRCRNRLPRPRRGVQQRPKIAGRNLVQTGFEGRDAVVEELRRRLLRRGERGWQPRQDDRRPAPGRGGRPPGAATATPDRHLPVQGSGCGMWPWRQSCAGAGTTTCRP